MGTDTNLQMNLNLNYFQNVLKQQLMLQTKSYQGNKNSRIYGINLVINDQ